MYTFQFPCTYSDYEKMHDDLELQKSFDTNIDVFECRKKIDEMSSVMYLAYKKIFIIAPRDFAYIEYKFKKGE